MTSRINDESRRNLHTVTIDELWAATMGTALDAPPHPSWSEDGGRGGKRPTRVYFVRMHVEDGPIKIGLSWNTYHRFSNLLTASPFELTYLGDIPGDEEIERGLHQRFAHLRMRGEWFRPGHDLLAYIADVLTRK